MNRFPSAPTSVIMSPNPLASSLVPNGFRRPTALCGNLTNEVKHSGKYFEYYNQHRSHQAEGAVKYAVKSKIPAGDMLSSVLVRVG